MPKSLIARVFDDLLERAFRTAFQQGYELGHSNGWMLHLEYTDTGKLDTWRRPSILSRDAVEIRDAWSAYRAEVLDEI